MLAAKLIQEQGIEVIGISFQSPFFGCAKGKKAAGRMGIEFHCIDITPKLLEVLKNPRHGYGKNLNPCIDCHSLMVAEACHLLEELGASFVVTGEVLGQRPKSQNRTALGAVSRAAGEGLLLRPLSARKLPETVPEKEGWVDREKLLDIAGRSRKRQLELAARWGLDGFATPAGGCLLTEEEYCRRLLELKEKEGWELEDILLLRFGRHFRLDSGAKAVSGRNEEENDKLEEAALSGDYLFQTEVHPGSLVLWRGSEEKPSEADLETAAAIAARYSKDREKELLKVRYWRKDDASSATVIAVRPIREEESARIIHC